MKTITKGLLIITLCMLGQQSNAQYVALKGGFNLSDFSQTVVNANQYKFTPGFHLGVNVDIPLGEMFAIETGVFATTKGAQVKQAYNGSTSKYTYNLLYTEMPVSFKTIFDVSDDLDIYASAGGYLGVAVLGVARYKFKGNGVEETTSEAVDFADDGLRRMDYGLTFGGGIEVKGFLLGASYDLGLANIDGSGYSILRNRVLKFSLGYRFGWDN